MIRTGFVLGILTGIVMFISAFGTSPALADTTAGDGHSFAWFRDADGDGIPNGMDEDWSRPEDGTGYQLKNRFGFFALGSFFGIGDSGNVKTQQYRLRTNRSSDAGDCLSIRQHLRDGSCK